MRILIAPDSFKECMTAHQAADAIARGLRRSLGDSVQLDLCPVADGGEGTLDDLLSANNGEVRVSSVTGPLGVPVDARWGILTDGKTACGEPRRTAIIETAQAIGLHLVPPSQRDPTRTTTFGVGQLILAASDAGASKIIVALGGSSTVDGGRGMAKALDAHRIKVEIILACDVTNPLFGPNGAAHIFGPQKGATPQQVEQLDAGLQNLASFFPFLDPNLPGMGAAGGLAFGLVAFCGAKPLPGIDLVLDLVRFHDRLQHADLVITGEGRFDAQSHQGKACSGVARAAAKHNIPVFLLAGSIERGAGVSPAISHPFLDCHSIVEDLGVPLAESLRRGPELLEELAACFVPRYVK